MSRIPLDLALDVTKVQESTIRRWVREGHVTRYPNGDLDYEELITRRDTRNVHCLAARRGIKQPQTVGVSHPAQQTRV